MKKNFTTCLCAITLILFISIILSGNAYKNKKNIKKYNLNDDNITYNNEVKIIDSDSKIKVYITKKNEIEELPIESYIVGVVCGEMPAEFSIEALKAQAVAARTYAAAHMIQYGGTQARDANGADVTDTVSCQVYMDKDIRMGEWPSSKANEYYNKICSAINDTKGEVITYNGKIIDSPFYFAVSSGETENSSDIFGVSVPYLKSVKSYGDNASSKFKTSVIIKNKDIINTINLKYKGSISVNKNLSDQIKILSRTNAGSVKTLKIGNTTVTGPAFRALLNLYSSNFNLKFEKNDIEITCNGYGHDVGMSQYGANYMAKDGKNYKDIIKHYYTDVNIEKLIK